MTTGIPVWVIMWLQVYTWVEVLDRCLPVLVPGWLGLPLSPTRFMLSTLLSVLGIGAPAHRHTCSVCSAPAPALLLH